MTTTLLVIGLRHFYKEKDEKSFADKENGHLKQQNRNKIAKIKNAKMFILYEYFEHFNKKSLTNKCYRVWLMKVVLLYTQIVKSTATWLTYNSEYSLIKS